MSDTTARTGRTAALVAAAFLGGTLLALSSIGIIPTIVGYFTDYWNGQAVIITARLPFVESGVFLEDGPGANYAGVLISSNEALIAPRLLQATAAALSSLIIIVGSLLVLLLATRMLRGRSFTRLLRWGLTALGLLVMATAAIAPQLQALAVDLAVVDLGYLIYGADSPAVLTES
ncbi:MAG: hypothetical protein Q7J04_04535, partial [Microcella sp.]|nr:hypothetical protein [Microcella sp.]